MHESTGSVQLKSGETVESCILTAPQPQWAPKMLRLLGHKGPPWRSQAEAALTVGLDVESRFYVLHRDGEPLANIMTTELAGVGLLGHVYTVPEDRRKGAAAILLQKLMSNFQGRSGRALFLGTGFDSPPYHLYARFGFEPVEPGSGEMCFYTGSQDQFNSRYFASGPVEIQPMGWPHWPTSAPLFTGAWPGVVRCASQNLVGRTSSEVPLLPLVMDNAARKEAGEPPRGVVIAKPETAAVTGLACFGTHPLWHTTTIIDVYCHHEYWRYAGELLEALNAPPGRHIAYADPTCQAKADALKDAGFKPTANLPGRIASDAAATGRLDLTVYERDR